VTDPKIETIDDARQLAIQFLRDAVDKCPNPLRVLVFGLWDGPPGYVHELLGLPGEVQVDIALDRHGWVNVLKSGKTYDLCWIIGADRLEAVPFAGMPGFGGSAALMALSIICLEPGARVVGVASSCTLLHALEWCRVEGQRFPKIKRELYILTRDDTPAKPFDPTTEPLA
jgi:hypothetical protein